jgi:hypothetical protein
MLAFMGVGLVEALFIRAPALAVQGGMWVASRAYAWCYQDEPTPCDLRAELRKVRFELSEMRDPGWVVVEREQRATS